MNITKISTQNSSFGINIHPWLQNKMKRAKSSFNRLAEGNLRETNILNSIYERNMEKLKDIYPNMNLRLLDTDKENNIDTYVVYDNSDNTKAKFTIFGEDPCYSKLLLKLKNLKL